MPASIELSFVIMHMFAGVNTNSIKKVSLIDF